MFRRLAFALFAPVLLIASCNQRPIPPDGVVRRPLGEGTIYRDTTIVGLRYAYLAMPGEAGEFPERVSALLEAGYSVVDPGVAKVEDVLASMQSVLEVDSGNVVLSSSDTLRPEGVCAVVDWTGDLAKGYVKARGGDSPLLQLGPVDPRTLVDLLERLVVFRHPLRIEADREALGEVSSQRPRHSWGEVVKSTHQFAVKGLDTLRLDVYRQLGGYDRPRPVILYSSAGGWQVGNRGVMDDPLFPFCTSMASMGYVVVDTDYRLGYRKASERGEVPAEDVAKLMVENRGTVLGEKIMGVCRSACLDAVEDLCDAASFVVRHASEWGADPFKIVLCGGGSGACNSLMAEYLLCNEDPVATTHLPKGFKFGGVVSCAGAMFTGDDAPEWKHRPSPMLLLHGTADQVVPYGTRPHFEGPASFVPTLPEHTPGVLYTVKGADHMVSYIPTGHMNHFVSAFIERYVVQGEESNLNITEYYEGIGDRTKEYLLNGSLYTAEILVRLYNDRFHE